MSVEVRGAADFITVPWRNGGGQTTELAREDGPGEIPLWRISRAAVTQDGPFSFFPETDRILVLLSGDGLIFDFGDGKPHRLTHPFDHIAFPGDVALTCRLVGGPCTDLNFMADRRRVRMGLHRHDHAGIARCANSTAFYAAAGAWSVDGLELEPGGVAVARNEGEVTLAGSGLLLHANFFSVN